MLFCHLSKKKGNRGRISQEECIFLSLWRDVTPEELLTFGEQTLLVSLFGEVNIDERNFQLHEIESED